MANFCGKCGNALIDGKCPDCNKNPQENIAVVSVTTKQTAPTSVIPATNNTPDKRAQRKAKKKAKWQALSKKQRTTRIILKFVAMKVEDPVIYWEKVDIKPDSVFSHTYN